MDNGVGRDDSILLRLALSAFIAAVIAGCAPQKTALDRPARGAERIFSSTGFSFLPPRGSNWTEDFGENQILYVKQTDVETVSFYAGALEGPLSSKLADKEALIAFVRSRRKDEWGEPGRYSDTVSKFHIEEEQEACVRYSLSAKDRGAKNLGKRDFLLMLSVGRFCLHPEDRTVAVDIYYSVRHAPQFDPRALVAEGDEFLEGLRFSQLSGQSTEVR